MLLLDLNGYRERSDRSVGTSGVLGRSCDNFWANVVMVAPVLAYDPRLKFAESIFVSAPSYYIYH